MNAPASSESTPKFSPEPGVVKTSWILFLVLTTVVTALDLWSKQAAFAFLGVEPVGSPPRIPFPPPDQYPIIENWFHLEANYNYGAFSGWFSKHTGILALLSVTALVVIVAILAYTFRAYSKGKTPRPSLWFVAALGLIAGGTAGNFYDRFMFRAVRDFIKWFYVDSEGKEHVWPNFNIADSGICVGVVILIALEFRTYLRERAEKKAQAAAKAPPESDAAPSSKA